MFEIIKKANLAIPVMIMALLAMFMLPLPPIVIDVLFTFNIVLSIMILLVAILTDKPLNFSIFPTVILVATVFRLALNVASTRVVLLEGHNGPDAAGQVIQSFGEVVIGGNYVVGLVVFVILMIVNFMVITKGGGRISEVAARFTLDSMPGKQMAIDADMNAGALTHEEASARRKEGSREADFYGSMDGASKFVKGDAIAGILILCINLIGGFFIGVFQHDLDAGEAIRIFSLLTIGDGLVAQIPSLLLATAAAIIVTRANDEAGVTEQVRSQLLASPRVLATAAGVMAVIGIIPGMPAFAFLSFAVLLGFAAWYQFKKPVEDTMEEAEHAEEFHKFISAEPALAWDDIPTIDKVRLDLGYRLVPLADQTLKTPLSSIIRGSRKKLSEQFGFLFPEVTIRDNLDIGPTEYRIKIDGVDVESGSIIPDKLIAIETPDAYGKLDGELVKEPAFGMDAVMIEPTMKSKALNLGYSVFDASTVISIHLGRILRERISLIFSHDDVISLNKRLESLSEPLNEALNAALNPFQQLNVFQKLLEDQVSVTDIKTVAVSLIRTAEVTKDPAMLVAEVRSALHRSIVKDINGHRTELKAFLLSDSLDSNLLDIFNQSKKNGHVDLENLVMDPNMATRIQTALAQIYEEMRNNNLPPVLIVSPQFRPQFAKFARLSTKGLHVLSFNEVPDNVEIHIAGHLG